MDKAKYAELQQTAILHGVKLKPRMQDADISDEDRAQYDKQAQAAYKKLQERFKASGGSRVTSQN